MLHSGSKKSCAHSLESRPVGVAGGSLGSNERLWGQVGVTGREVTGQDGSIRALSIMNSYKVILQLNMQR